MEKGRPDNIYGKSDKLLLLVRILMSLAIGMGLLFIYKNKCRFLRIFSILFIGVNLINSTAGYFAITYRYTVDKDLRTQFAKADDYLRAIPENRNILLITDAGWESEDSRLFDTYISRDFYVAEIDMIESNGFLKDSVVDLQSEPLPCNFPNEYGISFQSDFVEHIADFPLPDYSLYKNRTPGKIYFATEKYL